MANRESYKRGSSGKEIHERTVSTPAHVSNFRDRDVHSVDSAVEQFEPTEAMPVRQHARMAGGG